MVLNSAAPELEQSDAHETLIRNIEGNVDFADYESNKCPSALLLLSDQKMFAALEALSLFSEPPSVHFLSVFLNGDRPSLTPADEIM